MNDASPTSLDRLHDLVVPPPAPFWPPAPGWQVVFALVTIGVLVLALKWFIRWQQNHYRREALAELARIERAQSGSDHVPATALALSDLLKRTALTAYHRPDVAALTGPEWFRFLDEAAGTQFSQGLGEQFDALLYSTAAGRDTANPTAAVPAELFAQARAWIRDHRPC
ncbi:DUF4381 domain-containing protein [Marinihelvus fidelis]|uniref:DUF4381 domain-containing protein n=1 Tax=Marinihelvus fidelis TaxID=2613842 RepID=A0A5N0TER4_9GAMM|nr:DUF4381 domain-containing protein [Marinihelvus fidelis]KAA9133532.1 DUF4381 domain-containing protein [Marinihelvus fidelis]